MIYSLTFQQFLHINSTKIECEIIISSFVQCKFVSGGCLPDKFIKFN
jgi:hypothetical protein